MDRISLDTIAAKDVALAATKVVGAERGER